MPRLARHTFTLSDGHRIGLAVSGRGVPLVVVHGFTAEGFLYAQTLHRLVRKGFKVIAIDMAGHGSTQGLPGDGRATWATTPSCMGRAIDELGIKSAVLAGHSMGGRIVAQLAAQRPDQAIAVLLIDAIVGDEWDLMVNVFRVNPLLLGALGAALAVDTASTAPVLRDPEQAVKLARLLGPDPGRATSLAPWRLLGPGDLDPALARAAAASSTSWPASEVPTFVIHGERDLVRPAAAPRGRPPSGPAASW